MNFLRYLKTLLLISLLLAFLTGCSANVNGTLEEAPAAATAEPESSATAASSPTTDRPIRILLIGNNAIADEQGVGLHFERLVNSARPNSVEVDTSFFGYAPLSQLWDLNDNQGKISDGSYDLVVLEELIQSSSSFQESHTMDSFEEYAGKFDALIRKSGGRTVFFMSWPTVDPNLPPLDMEEVVAVHLKIASELKADVAPVALAAQRAMEERPELDLYASDLRYGPNVYGMYLAASVLYATIFGETPEGLSYRPEGLFITKDGTTFHTISDDEAAFLQRIAWETVQDNQTKR